MATLKLTETICDAIIAKLQAGLAARCTAINTEKADGITIAAPATDDYYPGGPGILTPVRTVIAVTETGSPEYGGEGAHSFIFQTDLGVFILDVDTNRTALARKLWRQARAVTEVLWDDAPQEALANSAFHLHPARHLPGPVYDVNNDQTLWSGWYGVVFRCKQLEA